MRMLVVNAGSSSLKLRLLGRSDELLAAARPDIVRTRTLIALSTIIDRQSL